MDLNGRTLTPDTPITLSWENGEGLLFEQVYRIDENYLVTVTQRVKNKGIKDVSVSPYGLVSRTSRPDILASIFCMKARSAFSTRP